MPGICTGNVYLQDPYDVSAALGCRSVRLELGGSSTVGKLTEYFRDKTGAKRLNSQLSPLNAAVPASGSISLTQLRGCVAAGFFQSEIAGYNSYLVLTSGAPSGSLSFNMTAASGSTSTFNSSKSGGTTSSLVPSTPFTSGYGYGFNGSSYKVIMTKTGGSVTPTGVNTAITLSLSTTTSWQISTTYGAGSVSFTGILSLYNLANEFIDSTKVVLQITKDLPPI